MNRFARWARRARLILRRSAVERSMDREFTNHVDQETAEHIRHGMSADAARRQALVDFGGLESTREAARDARGGRPVEDAAADLRYAGRILRRNPTYTAVAAATFALGLGVAGAIFSVFYGVLVRPLPYADPGRLLVIWERNSARNLNENVVSADNFQAWRDASHSFARLEALVPTSVTFTGTSAERFAGAEVSAGYFTLLGVLPATGRDFSDEDTRNQSTVIVSDAFWKQHLAGDPSIIGRRLSTAGPPLTVIGVMPAGFDPPAFGWLGDQAFWLPMTLTEANRAWGRYLLVVGRLKQGSTLAEARVEMDAIAARRQNVGDNRGWSTAVTPLATEITGDVRTSLVVIFVAGGLLLVMATTNVAMLTLSAMERRGSEFAVRRAIGASHGRLFRQLLTQSALVGALGSAVGLLIAVPGTRLLVSLLPPDMPRVASIRIDWPVLVGASAAALLATVTFGSVAARGGRRLSLLALTRREGDARTTARAGAGVLMSAEIAIAITVSTMALLMARSFVSLRGVDLGFDPRGVMAVRLTASGDAYASAESQRAFFDRVLERIRAVPHVRAVGLMSVRPFGGLGPADMVHDAQGARGTDAFSPATDVRVVSAETFQTLGVPLLSGTLFDRLTDVVGPPRVVINHALAQALWPGQNPIGHKLAMTMYDHITPEVIGVVGDVHLMDPRTTPRPTAYLSATRFTDPRRDLMIRTDLDPAAVLPSLRAAVAEVAPGLPLYQITSLPRLIDRALAPDRFTTILLAAFSGVALALAAIGVFGIFSADVTRRRKEIGLRLALGGTGTNVVALLLGRALKRAAVGLGSGIVLAALAARSMASILFGVGASDPVTLIGVAAGVAAIAACATLIPAAQALRASPLRALRED
jgi:putative ABC transport system permease protein